TALGLFKEAVDNGISDAQLRSRRTFNIGVIYWNRKLGLPNDKEKSKKKTSKILKIYIVIYFSLKPSDTQLPLPILIGSASFP
ncbi:2797_t:CDS:2, partial [Racocetra fulgida]